MSEEETPGPARVPTIRAGTRRALRSHRWALTMNYAVDDFIDYVTNMWTSCGHFQNNVRFFEGQIEIGMDTGHRHFQGYLETQDPLTFNQVKTKIFPRFPQLHLEQARGSQSANRAYVTKLETRAPGAVPLALGIPARDPKDKASVEQTTSYVIAQRILSGAKMADICRDHPSFMLRSCAAVEKFKAYVDHSIASSMLIPKSCYALIGPTGTGKTHYVWDRFGSDLCIVTPANVSMGGNGNPWMDSYEGQATILFDEMPRCMLAGWFLTVTNPYPFAAQAKGRFVSITARNLIFTSNIPVENWYPFEDDATKKAILDRFAKDSIITFAPIEGPTLRHTMGPQPVPLHSYPIVPVVPRRRTMTIAEIMQRMAGPADGNGGGDAIVPLSTAIIPEDIDDDEDEEDDTDTRPPRPPARNRSPPAVPADPVLSPRPRTLVSMPSDASSESSATDDDMPVEFRS